MGGIRLSGKGHHRPQYVIIINVPGPTRPIVADKTIQQIREHRPGGGIGRPLIGINDAFNRLRLPPKIRLAAVGLTILKIGIRATLDVKGRII